MYCIQFDGFFTKDFAELPNFSKLSLGIVLDGIEYSPSKYCLACFLVTLSNSLPQISQVASSTLEFGIIGFPIVISSSSTINKTLKSYVFAIVGAEYVLRWLPIGTHEWEKFVKPEELEKILTKNNLSLKKFDGMHFNIIKDEWSITKDLSVNYIAKFLKN